MLPRSLEQDVGAVYIGVCELVRVAEAEVDVRLGGKVEDGVDSVPPQHALDVGGQRDVALLKGKVGPAVEDARVVERGTVVEPVERDDVVVGVRENQMARKPAGSVRVSVEGARPKGRDAQLATSRGLVATYMKPAPPVMRMFVASGSGSNCVLPVNTGARVHSSSLT